MPDLINEVVVAVFAILLQELPDLPALFKPAGAVRENHCCELCRKALDTFLNVHYLCSFRKKERKKEPPYPSTADIYMTLSRNTCNPVKSHLMSSQHRIGMPHRELYASFQ
ncbi:hypothetical protein CEXT_158351 [Caerostris extrusa]|uniref:Uncharacterized protein n=1 Tax=Caerostris extrusa TaxID=172846 RepID=A0AAV4XGQ0_CAEEX|nr:hypothetical protein CEXT_158351 [Caerostris extrusa]